jgi:metal transporter CNNM
VRESQVKGATRRERTLEAVERGEVAEGEEEEEGLTVDEANIIKGVLDMKIKTVDQCMTPLAKVFMLSLDDKLDEKTMDKVRTCTHAHASTGSLTVVCLVEQILKSGFSRVPVYQGKKNNIIGMMIIKNLLKLSPKDAVPIEDLTLHRLPTVGADMPLYPMLDLFQRGQSTQKLQHKHAHAHAHCRAQSTDVRMRVQVTWRWWWTRPTG